MSDVDIEALINFHKRQGKLATVTAVSPPGRYGALEIKDGSVKSFIEKPKGDGAKINGGFFVLSPKVIDLIQGDETAWESEPLKRLAQMGELSAYDHDGFWQPMDTLREKNMLQDMWKKDLAPWKTW